MTPSFWRELQALLDQGFTGQLILHCNAGSVVKYEKRETLRPQTDKEVTDDHRGEQAVRDLRGLR